MALTSTSTVSNLIQTSYDKLVEMQLRSEPMFRKFAEKRPVDVTNPGNTVVFQIHKDLDRVTSTLSETADVDPVAMKNTIKVSVTVDEYGNALQRTERLALESISQIDPAIADVLAYNQMDSLDAKVWGVLRSAATGRVDGSTAANETAPNGEDISGGTGAAAYVKAADIRKAVAKLRGAKVQPKDGAFYVGLIHPDVSYDLRTEAVGSGANVWQQPHTYTEAGVGNMWTGEVGIYEGVKFIESPRVEATGTGASKKNYALILGKGALIEAVTYEPKTVIGPEVDALRRFRTVGWKFLGGWNIWRTEARYLITAKSSI